MKLRSIFSVSTAIVLLTACAGNADYEPAFNYGDGKNGNQRQQLNGDSMLKRSISAQSANTLAVPVANNTSAGSSGPVNPAHGVAGHRCDIPVGAPLDMPIQPNSQHPPAVATTTATQVTPTTITPANQPVAKGMNPAHGQPGHRCDIAVGAPLNSKPAPPATTTAANKVTTTPQKTAPGMNPPHGEAGHRCDIAVGAPLNSKPATPAASANTAAPIPPISPAPIPAVDSAH